MRQVQALALPQASHVTGGASGFGHSSALLISWLLISQQLISDTPVAGSVTSLLSLLQI